ncbi:MAG: hypothetical protein KGI78_01975 [Patescibacteria group bacterium]|nr:hypothetical protein [Patescibacteria group bacterium]MDE1944093.1 hypothetical protein [Patescibacteria group bacterium]MDE1944710.1 hypothetical protein [Patescibacteria group bacterium]MDE2057601.1 hypothetical protein [Patescibacteria group bacterium]
MIYLFHGSDTERVRAKAFEWVAKARAKNPALSYARLAREELSVGLLDDAANAGGLFVSRLLILLDDPFPVARASAGEGEAETDVSETPTSGSLVEDALDRLAASDNAIVILAPKLASAKAKKIIAKAKQAYAFDLAAKRAERGFNSALVNALASRSPERLWLEVVRALGQGDAPEQLHGLLHWKARDILEKGSAKWKPAEARTLSADLIALLMDARAKGFDLALALERFALAI